MLIDTNVYAALSRGRQDALEALRASAAIYLPIIVVGELYYGFANGNRQAENARQLDVFLARDAVEVMHITPKTAVIYGELAVFCRKMGRSLSDNGLWIAALVKEHGMTFVTYDRDFEAFEALFGDQLLMLRY